MLIFIGALAVLLSHKPEQVFSRSENGAVTIEGISGTVRTVIIEPMEQFDVSFDKRMGEYYQLIPNPSGVTFTSEVTIQITEQWKQLLPDITELLLYRFDTTSHTWQSIPTVVDLSSQTLHARLDFSAPTVIVVGIK